MKNDTTKIIFWFLVAFFLVYGLPRIGLPTIINQLAFLLLLVYVYRSNDNVLWLTWFFIILDTPGVLFASSSGSEIYRLPFFSVSSGFSISFQELFLVTFLLKMFITKNNNKFIFKRYIQLLMILGVVYFMISFLIGISGDNIVRTVRALSSWLWLLIIPYFIKDAESLDRVLKMIIPFVFFAFLSAIQEYFTGLDIGQILRGTQSYNIAEPDEALIRIASSDFLLFFALTQSIYQIARGKSSIRNGLLLVVITLSTMTIFLSATRGWIIGLVILYFSIFFVYGFSKIIQTLRITAVIVVLILIIAYIIPSVSTQAEMAYERVMTLESLAQGDLTAGGTLARITERSPRVMAVWRESPIIGWAFSNKFYAYGDNHVGNQTNLLNLGLLGFLLFNGIYFAILQKTLVWGRSRWRHLNAPNTTIIYVFAMLSIFFMHSTSGSIWTYRTIGAYHVPQLLLAFLFTAISVAINAQHPTNNSLE